MSDTLAWLRPLWAQMTGVTLESCQDLIQQFEPCPENKSKGVLGIDGEWAAAGCGGRGQPVARGAA